MRKTKTKISNKHWLSIPSTVDPRRKDGFCCRISCPKKELFFDCAVQQFHKFRSRLPSRSEIPFVCQFGSLTSFPRKCPRFKFKLFVHILKIGSYATPDAADWRGSGYGFANRNSLKYFWIHFVFFSSWLEAATRAAVTARSQSTAQANKYRGEAPQVKYSEKVDFYM